eukprot:TRINITY_DN7902_c0_g1_i1.p1 TRINITY_DN7902_c0_g1~~TRINITY_DN7902_c0_g1_i1.p1  ORF type:complete len:1060 (+),score=164.13 TRINITY_DN7902_c0_g1_i1:84-3263(+)
MPHNSGSHRHPRPSALSNVTTNSHGSAHAGTSPVSAARVSPAGSRGRSRSNATNVHTSVLSDSGEPLRPVSSDRSTSGRARWALPPGQYQSWATSSRSGGSRTTGAESEPTLAVPRPRSGASRSSIVSSDSLPPTPASLFFMSGTGTPQVFNAGRLSNEVTCIDDLPQITHVSDFQSLSREATDSTLSSDEDEAADAPRVDGVVPASASTGTSPQRALPTPGSVRARQHRTNTGVTGQSRASTRLRTSADVTGSSGTKVGSSALPSVMALTQIESHHSSYFEGKAVALPLGFGLAVCIALLTGRRFAAAGFAMATGCVSTVVASDLLVLSERWGAHYFAALTGLLAILCHLFAGGFNSGGCTAAWVVAAPYSTAMLHSSSSSTADRAALVGACVVALLVLIESASEAAAEELPFHPDRPPAQVQALNSVLPVLAAMLAASGRYRSEARSCSAVADALATYDVDEALFAARTASPGTAASLARIIDGVSLLRPYLASAGLSFDLVGDADDIVEPARDKGVEHPEPRSPVASFQRVATGASSSAMRKSSHDSTRTLLSSSVGSGQQQRRPGDGMGSPRTDYSIVPARQGTNSQPLHTSSSVGSSSGGRVGTASALPSPKTSEGLSRSDSSRIRKSQRVSTHDAHQRTSLLPVVMPLHKTRVTVVSVGFVAAEEDLHSVAAAALESIHNAIRHSGHGLSHFHALDGNRAQAVFTGNSQELRACRAALDTLIQPHNIDCRMSGGVVSKASAWCGFCGGDALRAFAVLGSAFDDASTLSQYGLVLRLPCVVDDRVGAAVQYSTFTARCIDHWTWDRQGSPRKIFEVADRVSNPDTTAAGCEWLYELMDSRLDPFHVYNAGFAAFEHGHWEQARHMLTDFCTSIRKGDWVSRRLLRYMDSEAARPGQVPVRRFAAGWRPLTHEVPGAVLLCQISQVEAEKCQAIFQAFADGQQAPMHPHEGRVCQVRWYIPASAVLGVGSVAVEAAEPADGGVPVEHEDSGCFNRDFVAPPSTPGSVNLHASVRSTPNSSNPLLAQKKSASSINSATLLSTIPVSDSTPPEPASH